MPSESLFDRMQEEWKRLPDADLPPAESVAHGRPGRFALYGMLEEPLALLMQMHNSGLLNQYGARFVNASWSVRDLVTHLASWARELRDQVRTIAEGRGFDYAIPFALSVVGPNEWNHRELEKRKDGSAADAVREYEMETRRLQDMLLELPEAALYSAAEFPMAPSGNPSARWHGNVAMMVFAQSRHFVFHMNQIRLRLLRFK